MLLESVMEPSVIEIRVPPLFTQTANKPCEGCRCSGRGMKHILLVKLCKHSSCSHQSLESYVVVFSQTEPSFSLGEPGLAVQIAHSNVSYVAALILTSPWDIHQPNLSNRSVFGSRPVHISVHLTCKMSLVDQEVYTGAFSRVRSFCCY